MHKKSVQNCTTKGGITPSNMTPLDVQLLDLKYIKKKSYTKFQLNMSKHKECVENGVFRVF